MFEVGRELHGHWFMSFCNISEHGIQKIELHGDPLSFELSNYSFIVVCCQAAMLVVHPFLVQLLSGIHQT